MYYHARVTFPEPRIHGYWNYSKESLINKVIIPFFNGQIITGKRRGRTIVLNLSSAVNLEIFRTQGILTDEQTKELRNTRKKIGVPCTDEILSEIRFDVAIDSAKSLMEKIIQLPKKQIFVIMKFDDAVLDSAYLGVVRPLAEEFGYHTIRIDDIEDSGRITEQIIEKIAESEIIYSDLSGERPNCYFETGFAMATGREIILTIKDTEQPHFDLASHRFIKWSTEHDLRNKLRARLETIITRKE